MLCFQLSPNLTCMHQMASCNVRRHSGEEFRQECLVSMVKHPDSQIIWECIYSAKELVVCTL